MRMDSQLHDLTAYPQGKSPRPELIRGLCGPHKQSRHFGEEKICYSYCKSKDNSLDAYPAV
jgi:hypothetical protein